MQGFRFSKLRPVLGAATRLLAGSTGLAALATSAAALPIGFGINQGQLEYDELKSEHFRVYFDHRVPAEGRGMLNALEAARPYAERWLGQSRQTPLTVITSAATENASFANFLTDAIEIQTMGQGYKELAWHEYTHSTMYRALDNVFGPAGNILHLPWMPAWFLEGLAESFSVSSGSDVTAGIERYQALSGDWPSYDRLHSLYSTANFVERGYATAGAMVSYLLRRGDAQKLPDLLHTFYRDSLPWWWPTTIIPYAEMMPLDRALKGFVGMNGEDFYEAYKKAAREHWDRSHRPFLHARKGARKDFASTFGLSSDGEHVRLLSRDGLDYYEWQLQFDSATGWAKDWQRGQLVSTELTPIDLGHGQQWSASVTYNPDPPQDQSTIVWRNTAAGSTSSSGSRKLKRDGAVYNVWETPTHLAWSEQQQSVTRLCEMPKDGKAVVHCPLQATLPKQLRPIGQRSAPGRSAVAGELWFSAAEQKLDGTGYQVRVYDTLKHAVRRQFSTGFGQPLAVAFAGREAWLLLGERSERTLRHYDEHGRCVDMMRFNDHILDVKGLKDGSLVLALYGGVDQHVIRLAPQQFRRETCTQPTGQMSPLQYAVSHDRSSRHAIDLKTALTKSSLWASNTSTDAQVTSAAFAAAPTIDQAVQPGTASETTPASAKWRARPLFIFPWIGAEDALGIQLGVVSVPLMDELQNETVRATILYGVYSRFPYSELALTSTRFRPTLNLALYREQTFNGFSYSNAAAGDVADYYDEKGARLESLLTTRLLGGFATFGLALKYAYLKTYMGNPLLRHGFLTEPGASFSLTNQIRYLTWTNSIAARMAPAGINKHFDYNQVGVATTASVPLPKEAKFSLGLEASRTRGAKRRHLQEMYRPLKTFIPGSGGGYNQNSYPVAAVNGGLFAAAYGEASARGKADLTVPIIRDLDKNWWLLYFERLDFSAFYNYGSAWNGSRPPQGWNHLTSAHGYNLDLQMENKGVRFNVGGGIGQVVGRRFEAYLNAGYDAIF